MIYYEFTDVPFVGVESIKKLQSDHHRSNFYKSLAEILYNILMQCKFLYKRPINTFIDIISYLLFDSLAHTRWRLLS